MYLPDVGPVTSHGGVPGDRLFAAGTQDNRSARLMALLALDGDDTFSPFGDRAGSDRLTTRQMAGVCVALGHALYREAFSREMGISLPDWDRRVFAAWSTLAPT